MTYGMDSDDARGSDVTLIVIAKEPVAGRVKTRLCPPCTPEQAAELAAAALQDTLTAVAETPAARRIVCLDGRPGAWLPDGFDVVPQSGGGLDERLAHAFAGVDGPALLIGMDTPQVTPALLAESARELVRWPNGSVLGLAFDGGWWAVGLRRPDPGAFLGVPMSAADTGARQRDRLCARGSIPTLLPELRDVDTYADAQIVAADLPRSRFARAFARITDQIDGPTESEDAA
jgi:uncharacterized protein